MFYVSTRRLSLSCGIALAVATLLGSSPAAARRSAADGIAKLRALLSHRP